jgi:hypothetical protein
MRRVSARVSTPETPMRPFAAIHSPNSPVARKLEWRVTS